MWPSYRPKLSRCAAWATLHSHTKYTPYNAKTRKRKGKRKKNGKEQSSTGWMWSLSAHRVNTTQQVHHTMQLLSRASVPRKALPSGASKHRSSKHYKLQQEVANLIRCPICGINSVQPVAGNLDHLVPVCREPP